MSRYRFLKKYFHFWDEIKFINIPITSISLQNSSGSQLKFSIHTKYNSTYRSPWTNIDKKRLRKIFYKDLIEKHSSFCVKIINFTKIEILKFVEKIIHQANLF